VNLVLFTHPPFLGLRSQGHFARLLAEAYRARGHTVAVRQPDGWLHQRWPHRGSAKWAGYVDQYLCFPRQMRAAMRQDPADTLYVFCDQALGPWVPVAAHRPHVVHCHDLLALRSALGDIPENPTSLTGRAYQRYIRSGFQQARHFISISRKSRADLHRFGGVNPRTSEVVYNGLNHPYQPMEAGAARQPLQQVGLQVPAGGYLLHVGAGQWYKNTAGVVALYAAYVRAQQQAGQEALPLWMLSPSPRRAVQDELARVPAAGRVQFLPSLNADALQAAYSLAQVMLFPSLAEGFGWPIVEAMACGCPVVTTGEAPMNEVGGEAAVYVRRLQHGEPLAVWAQAAAWALLQLLGGPQQVRQQKIESGRAWAQRFGADQAIDSYLEIYRRVLGLGAAGGTVVLPGQPVS